MCLQNWHGAGIEVTKAIVKRDDNRLVDTFPNLSTDGAPEC